MAKLFNKPKLDWKEIDFNHDYNYKRIEARFCTNLFAINTTSSYIRLRFEGELIDSFNPGEVEKAKEKALEYCQQLIIDSSMGINLPDGYSLTAIGHKEIVNQGFIVL